MTPIQKWLSDQWGEENARTLQSMTDVRPSASCAVLDKEEAGVAAAGFGEGASITEVTFAFGKEAIMWIALPDTAVNALGGRTLTAAGIEDSGAEDIRNTCLEIVQQAHAGLAQAISRRLQQGVSSKGVETVKFPTDYTVFRLELSFPESPAVLTYFTISPGMLAGLEVSDPASTPKTGESSVASAQPATPNLSTSKTFDVMLEVSMPVSVSFGRTEMLIKEVLKLTTGSIVELNRNVTEPVDVIVNDRVIARGEVVVVDGNYGVRIQKIVSLQERFRSSTQPVGKAEVVAR